MHLGEHDVGGRQVETGDAGARGGDPENGRLAPEGGVAPQQPQLFQLAQPPVGGPLADVPTISREEPSAHLLDRDDAVPPDPGEDLDVPRGELWAGCSRHRSHGSHAARHMRSGAPDGRSRRQLSTPRPSLSDPAEPSFPDRTSTSAFLLHTTSCWSSPTLLSLFKALHTEPATRRSTDSNGSLPGPPPLATDT